MFCIKNNKLFGCADYTVSTSVLGVVLTLFAFVNIFSWAGSCRLLSIYNLILGIACIALIFYKENMKFRQILIGMYLLGVTLWVIRLVWFVLAWSVNIIGTILFVYVFVVDAVLLTLIGIALFAGYKEQQKTQQQA